jgi:hemerythrin superfamily protein
MDAITLLKDDHKAVAKLFRKFEKAGDKAFAEKREIVERIIEALSVHAAIEEELFYPVARATVPGTEDMALESLEEHHIVKWVLSELNHMDPEDERYDAKVTVLIENVRHHVEEEEEDFFPKVRDELGRNALNDLGDAMVVAKKSAPTHPHPRSPDTPPGNVVMGTAAGVADRIGDTVSGLAQGGVSAVGDLIATVLNRKTPRVAATGSPAARRTATKVRAGAKKATASAKKTTRTAKRTGQRATTTARTTRTSAAAGVKRTARTATREATGVARTAKSGAKGTATSTRKATKRVGTTAKRATTTTRRAVKKAARTTATTAKRSARQTASTTRRSAAQV